MAGKVVSGKEGHWYIYRVKVMKDYLTKIFGKPDFAYAAPTMEKLLTHKGIIIFEVEGWGDASGHATIWDGLRCSDKCYFDKAKKVHLWSLEN